jgi:hypothetical protein
MALYNPGGDAKAIFKYDAKQGIGKIDNDQVPLKNFKAIFDMDALELGYCRFGENTQPVFHMVLASDEKALAALKRPEVFDKDGKPLFKWGVRLHLKLTKELAGSSSSVREFASNSYVTFNGISALYDEWAVERHKHPGKLPIVAGKAPIPVPGAHGKNFQPVFVIVGWIDPPEDLVAMRNGKAPPDDGAVPTHVAEVEGEPEAMEPVDFSEDGEEF